MLKKCLSIAVCLIMIIGQLSFVNAAEFEDDYRNITQITSGEYEIKKPSANFKVTVLKPDGVDRYKDQDIEDQPSTSKDLAYDEFGNVRDMSLIPVITAYVGDTLKFKDDSDTGSGNLEKCEFQWYSEQGSGGMYLASKESFENKTFTLTKPGHWELYYQVRDDYPSPLMPNWSDNGCHVVRDFTNPDFLPTGMLWYYTRVDVEVLSEPDPVPGFKITHNGIDVTDKNFEITSFPCTVTLKDTSTTEDGAKLTSREWKAFSNAELEYKPIGSATTISYTITADQVSGVAPKYFLLELNNKNSLNVSHYSRPYLKEAPPEDDEPNPPDPDPNIPPVALIDAPEEVRMGEEFTFSGLGSYDEDGDIVEYTMSDQSANLVSAGDGYRDIWYGTKGRRTLRLNVKDDRGARSSASQKINVIDPLVYASISCTGALKEKRRVNLSDSSSSPERYPIVKELTQWSFTPVSGGTAADIKYYGGMTGVNAKQVLFKKAGQYKVTLTVTNTAGFTDMAERIITIAPDQAPIADFNIAASALHNPDAGKQAQIKLTDKSYSPDGDIISQRIWSYAYDSDNDGLFTDEAWIALDNGNNAAPVLTVGSVGKYKFELNVKESFGQATIEGFVTSADYKTSNTAAKIESSKICDVMNVAPSSAFNVYHRKKIDVQILVDQSMATDLQNNIAVLDKKLLENHIDADIKIDTVFAEGKHKPAKKIGRLPAGTYEADFYIYGDAYSIKRDGLYVIDHTGSYTAHIPTDIGSIMLETRVHLDARKELLYMIEGDGGHNKICRDVSDFYIFDLKNNKLLSKTTANISEPGYSAYQLLYSTIENNKLSVVYSLYKENSTYVMKLIVYDLNSGAIIFNQIDDTEYQIEKWYWTSLRTYHRHGRCFVGFSYETNSRYELNANKEGDTRYQFGTNNIIERRQTKYPNSTTFYYPMWRLYNGSTFYIETKDRNYDVDDSWYHTLNSTNFKEAGIHDDQLVKKLPSGYIPTRADARSYAQIAEGHDLDVTKDNEWAPYNNFKWGYYITNSTDKLPDDSGYYMDIYDVVQPRVGMFYDKLTAHNADQGTPSYRIAMLDEDLYPEGAYNVARTIRNKNLNMLLMAGTNSGDVQEFKSILTSKATITNAALSSDLNTNINTIANYIIGQNTPEKVGAYIILNEALDYETFYSDYEADPQYSGRWKFTHSDPNYFDNSLGVLANQGQYITNPIVTFDKVGKIIAAHQVRDNPKDVAQFDNYRLWSAEKILEFFVHRRPVAEFSLAVKPGTGNYIPIISDTSYDLDHTSRSDKGITARKWAWRESGSALWTNGQPAAFAANKSYEVQLQVQDMEGAWSTPLVKTVDTGNVNLPPIVDANPKSANATANIPVVVTADDFSENDFDHTSYYWSKYTSKPSGSWTNRTTKSFTTTLTTEGTWYLHMEAYDNSGQSFYIYRGPYTLIKNQAPTVSISASPAIIYENDDVTIRMIPVDPDGDATQLSLQSSKDGGAWTTIFTKSGCISSQAQSYTLQNVASGSYRLRVVATDPSGLNASAETIFSTNLLDITGQVRHTDLWDAHRQQYNNAKSGSANSPRAYDEFFPGERFMLVADTSVIDASRPDL